MKKDRNCMYPVYPSPYMGMPAQGMNPGMMGPMMPNNYIGSYPMPQSTVTNINTTDINTLSNQVNNLEKRVTVLENMIGANKGTYNNSTYQMM